MKKNLTTWVIIGAVLGITIIFVALKSNVNLPSIQNGANSTEGEESLRPVTSGSSAVNKEGVVVNPNGEAARNDAPPTSPEAPKQSNPISEDVSIPDSVKIEMTRDGLTPQEFTVRAGKAVTLVITAKDENTHVFKFRDASLQGVAVGVGPGETRSITFNAPSEKGNYEYYCDVPNHAAEIGKMTVK